MKLKNILLATLLVAGFSSCNDFLEVEAPSKYDKGYVYSDKVEINRALNGVYAQLLKNETYGKAYLTTFCLNSDVDMNISSNEMATDNSYRRFDCNSQGSDINKFWSAAYTGIEYANEFINGVEESPIYSEEDTELMQMLGEAKVIRAMYYHDLIVMFGDIPFSLTPNSEVDDFVMPVTDREEVHRTLIEDLKSIAPYMQFSSNLDAGIERVSKEFCWAMIARMALTCGGYSLHPDKSNPTSYGVMKRPDNYKDYYKLTRDYCDSIRTSGTHALNLSYHKVFIDECNYIVNNGDDPIFEIPFAKNSTGNVGYVHGPKAENYEGATNHAWGKSDGGARLSAFYRYSFDEEDSRRDFVNGLWYYLYTGEPTPLVDYTVFNNKWSKLWTTSGMGKETTENTGINYPYMRYTDVLLMYAEAENELNEGPTGEAVDALRTVRRRAFTNSSKVDDYLSRVSGSKEAFLKAVLDERKWEFAGENMRWKDLVRNNLYSEVIYYSFLRYYATAENAGGSSSHLDELEQYEPIYVKVWNNTIKDYVSTFYLEGLPIDMYYRIIPNPKKVEVYPNTGLDIFEISNPYARDQKPAEGEWSKFGSSKDGMYAWWNEGNGKPNNQCLYSFYGFIRGDVDDGNIYIIRDGERTAMTGVDNLPVVRYILPYPNAAIQRSAGAYKNYYGYIR